MKSWLKGLLLLLGLSLFAWFVHRAGPREVLAVFGRLGPWVPVALLPFLLVSILDTLGWRLAFAPTPSPPSYRSLLRIRWAGEAVNSVIPTGYVGGEAIKAWLLARRGYPLAAATTSVVVSKTLQVMAQVLFIAVGAGLAMMLLPVDSGARRGFALVSLLAAIVAVLLLWIQSRGLFSFVRSVSTALRLRALERHEVQLRDLDDRIFGFYRRHTGRCLASGAAFFAGWVADALELYVVSHLLGFPMDYATAMAIESFISIAKALGIFVPGALGVQESGVWLLFRLFGFTEAQALAYAILRRGREVIFAGLGGLLLSAEGASLRRIGADLAAGGVGAAGPAETGDRAGPGADGGRKQDLGD